MLIAAEARLPAPCEDVFALVADLDRHRVLTDDGLRIVRLDGPVGRRSGGLVELRGPLGVRRWAATQVGGSQFPSRLWGTAETPSGSRGHIRWHLRPDGSGTRVRVELDITAGAGDRVLLACGGRRWLRRRAQVGLRRLAAAYASGSGSVRPASLSTPPLTMTAREADRWTPPRRRQPSRSG